LCASKNISRVKIKEDQMDGACSMHERDEKCIKNFGQKNLRGRDNLEDLDVGRRTILGWILGK